MIHYITTQEVGDAWVGNELRIVAKAGIPFRLYGTFDLKNCLNPLLDRYRTALETAP